MDKMDNQIDKQLDSLQRKDKWTLVILKKRVPHFWHQENWQTFIQAQKQLFETDAVLNFKHCIHKPKT